MELNTATKKKKALIKSDGVCHGVCHRSYRHARIDMCVCVCMRACACVRVCVGGSVVALTCEAGPPDCASPRTTWSNGRVQVNRERSYLRIVHSNVISWAHPMLSVALHFIPNFPQDSAFVVMVVALVPHPVLVDKTTARVPHCDTSKVSRQLPPALVARDLFEVIQIQEGGVSAGQH